MRRVREGLRRRWPVVLLGLLLACFVVLLIGRVATRDGHARLTDDEHEGRSAPAEEPTPFDEVLDGGSLDEVVPDLPSAVLADRSTTVEIEEGEVGQVATSLLVSYRDRGNCVLASSGYLDLMGSVWGCVVNGGRWVDVCVVSDKGDGTSQVAVLHLDADEVERDLGKGGRDDEGA